MCLARACYRPLAWWTYQLEAPRLRSSSIFVLDDPYSALDAHVARDVHEKAVLGGTKSFKHVLSGFPIDFQLFLSETRSIYIGPFKFKQTPIQRQAYKRLQKQGPEKV